MFVLEFSTQSLVIIRNIDPLLNHQEWKYFIQCSSQDIKSRIGIVLIIPRCIHGQMYIIQGLHSSPQCNWAIKRNYSSNDIVNSVLTTTVNNVSHSTTQEEKYSSIVNSEIITVNNVIEPTNATQILVLLLGINYLMASSYKPDNPCSITIDTSNSSTNDIVNSEMITVNNVTGPSSEDYSSNEIVNSVLTTTVDNVSYSTIKK